MADVRDKTKAGIDDAQPVQLRRFPGEAERWERLLERLLSFSSVEHRVRLPREVREALAQLGISPRPGNVRLPPLPPLWR